MSIMHRFSTSQPLSNVCAAIIISRGCSMLSGDLSPFEPISCFAVLETRMSKTEEDTKLKGETYHIKGPGQKTGTSTKRELRCPR